MAGEKKVERFGSPISDYVIAQIQQRQSAIGSNSKTRDQYEYLTSNTSWVKLRSSVNRVNATEAKQALENNEAIGSIGTSIPAQNYVLLGGTLNPESRTPRSGILRSPTTDRPNTTGEASLYRDTEAYLNYKSTGIRPMPGVTGMTVKHKNTYGTLMEATVNFNVWSKEQLEDVELLYFRPGYTALLEWGHSIYLDNSGNVNRATESMTVPEGLFFKQQNQMSEIDKEIISRRDRYKGNYQGLFGFITNFNWSYRNDGGYDCSVKIVARGIVIESLKTPNISAQTPDDELPSTAEQDSKKREKSAEAFKSMFSYLDSCLQNYSADEGNNPFSFSLKKYLSEEAPFDKYKANAKTLANKITSGLEQSSFDLNYTENNYDYKVWHSFFKEVEDEPSWWPYGSTGNLFWISMKTFLSLVNQLYLLKNPVNKEFITFFSLAEGEKFKSFSDHFSIDPMIAMVPRVPKSNPDFVIRKKDSSSLNSDMQSYAKGNNGVDDIMNIMISTNFLASEASRIIEATEQGIGVTEFVKSVLRSINKAFGGINNLDIFYDHDICVLKIVDRGFPLSPSKFPVINVTGINNTVSELKVQSKISSNIASQISIAAQGHSGTYGENLKAMLQWNAGALDRHITRKDQSTNNDDTKNVDKVDKPIIQEVIGKAFAQFIDDNKRSGNVNLNLWSQIRSEGASYINQLYLGDISSPKKFEPMPVPIELSFKMPGISGIKIASTFQINKQVLPLKYHKYAFIVTGVDHEIGTDNKWYTTVTAQFYATGL